MKQLSQLGLILILASVLLSLFGGVPAFAGSGPEQTPAAAGQERPAFETREQRLSYALGMTLGKQFREQSVAIDTQLYQEGFEDALSGRKTRLTETEARNAVNLLQSELSRKQFTTRPSEIPLSDLKISFKLDPRLTRSMYMGDRWVSPPTFTIVQNGTEAAIPARVQGVNSKGSSLKVNPEWIAEAPEMITIIPARGDEVSILVRQAGESRVYVNDESGISKQLTIKATGTGETIKVEITQ